MSEGDLPPTDLQGLFGHGPSCRAGPIALACPNCDMTAIKWLAAYEVRSELFKIVHAHRSLRADKC